MTTQQTENITRDLEVREQEMTKRLFVEPSISSPVDVLETTAFFQVTTGNSDVTPDVTG